MCGIELIRTGGSLVLRYLPFSLYGDYLYCRDIVPHEDVILACVGFGDQDSCFTSILSLVELY